MGRAKEEQLEREEQARLHAPKCDICNAPLMSSSERSNRPKGNGQRLKATVRTNFIALLILLCVVSTATAGDDYYEALKAYMKADYATAFRLVRPLADQGNARTASTDARPIRRMASEWLA